MAAVVALAAVRRRAPATGSPTRRPAWRCRAWREAPRDNDDTVGDYSCVVAVASAGAGNGLGGRRASFSAASSADGWSFRWCRIEWVRAVGLAMRFAGGEDAAGQVRYERLADKRAAIADGSWRWRQWTGCVGGCCGVGLMPAAVRYWNRCNIVTEERLGPAASGDDVAGC